MWYTLLLYLHGHTSKNGKLGSTPLYPFFKLTKYSKNVKLKLFNENEFERS